MPEPMQNLQVNGERLWASLMELAKIGATAKGGICRLAASDLDGEAQRLFIGWCEAAGCAVRVDRIGNIFARRPSRNPRSVTAAAISHFTRRSAQSPAAPEKQAADRGRLLDRFQQTPSDMRLHTEDKCF